MTVVELLHELKSKDIRLWLDGDRLRVNAPEGALDADLRAQIQQRKPEIVEFLAQADALAQQARAVVPLQPEGDATPLFAVAGHNGDVFCYRALARELGTAQPFFGLQPPGLDGRSEPLTKVEDLASYFASEIGRARPDGPVRIAGFCAGGTVALELARTLHAQGREVETLWLFGTPFPLTYRPLPELNARVAHIGRQATRHALAALANPAQALSYLRDVQEQRRAAAAEVNADVSGEVLAMRLKVEQATLQAIRQYQPQPFAGFLCLFLPAEDWRNSSDEPMRWRDLAAHYSEQVGPAGCNGDNMLRDAYAASTAALVRRELGITQGQGP